MRIPGTTIATHGVAGCGSGCSCGGKLRGACGCTGGRPYQNAPASKRSMVLSGLPGWGESTKVSEPENFCFTEPTEPVEDSKKPECDEFVNTGGCVQNLDTGRGGNPHTCTPRHCLGGRGCRRFKRTDGFGRTVCYCTCIPKANMPPPPKRVPRFPPSEEEACCEKASIPPGDAGAVICCRGELIPCIYKILPEKGEPNYPKDKSEEYDLGYEHGRYLAMHCAELHEMQHIKNKDSNPCNGAQDGFRPDYAPGRNKYNAEPQPYLDEHKCDSDVKKYCKKLESKEQQSGCIDALKERQEFLLDARGKMLDGKYLK